MDKASKSATRGRIAYYRITTILNKTGYTAIPLRTVGQEQ